MFCVCDGHGHYGREVSQFIKDKVPYLLQEQLQNRQGQPAMTLKDYDEMFDYILTQVDAMLAKQPFDVHLSGSTVVLVFFDGTRLLCANVGDSRAIKSAIFYEP